VATQQNAKMPATVKGWQWANEYANEYLTQCNYTISQKWNNRELTVKAIIYCATME